MLLSYIALLSFCASVLPQGASHPLSSQNAESDAAQVMAQLSKEYHETTLSTLSQASCNCSNIAVRKEWETLTKAERLNYIDAVKCLRSKPSRVKDTLARSRYEDLTLAHIQQTDYIHFSGLLLPWHRYFLYLHETALREECGYKGYQPYWDWSKYLAHTSTASIFDGSPYSLSGNGEFIPDRKELNITLPGGAPPGLYSLRHPGTGGGCIQGKPFEDIVLQLDADNHGHSTPVDIFDKQRCLKRDFYRPLLEHMNSYEKVTDLILNKTNIHTFHPDLEYGVHPGGHFFIGGENLNLFTSPSDPAFFLHHAMVDRVWAIWQSLDPETRQYALDGTLTSYNYPPSPNATLTDWMHVGAVEKSRQIKEVMSTTQGLLCYVYT